MLKDRLQKKVEKKQGFTLVEIMVAVSIFTIVVTVGMGALLVVNNAYKQSKDRRQAVASVASAIEYMMREMRTGRSFICDPSFGPIVPGIPTISSDCFPPNSSGSDMIRFIDQDGNEQRISFISSVAGYPGIGQIVKTSNNVAQPVTDPSIVDIQDLTFYVRGVSDNPTSGIFIQPAVVVRIKGKVIGQQSGDFTFQSAISQRLLDVSAAS